MSTHSVLLVPAVECTVCNSAMQVHSEYLDPRNGLKTGLFAYCGHCDITVKLPIAPLPCEIVEVTAQSTKLDP